MEKVYVELNRKLLENPLEYFCASYENFSKDVSFRLEKELGLLKQQNVNTYMDYQFIAAYHYRNALFRYRHAYEEMIRNLDIKDKNIEIDQKFIRLENAQEQILRFLNNMKGHSSFMDVATRIETDVYSELKKINSGKTILLDDSFPIKKTILTQAKSAKSYHLNDITKRMMSEIDNIFAITNDELRYENDTLQAIGQERAPRLVRAMNQFKGVDIKEEMILPERLDPNIFKT